MNTTTQNSSQIFEDLKARKAHLISVLKMVDSGTKKSTMQKLTITAIKAEMAFIEQKQKKTVIKISGSSRKLPLIQIRQAAHGPGCVKTF
jgi:hypothetical protein